MLGTKRGSVGRPPATVVLTDLERAELLRRTHMGRTTLQEAMRISVILHSAEGKSAREIAMKLDVSTNTVYKWRNRFIAERLNGLKDAPRCGHPVIFGSVERMQIISIACEPCPRLNGTSGWTIPGIKAQAIQRGIVQGISEFTVWKILNDVEIKPYKVRGWVHSPDPKFKEKVNEITKLYHSVSEGAIVLSVDEKTGMQAVERRYEDKPAQPDVPLRREFEYKRHGTQSLIAAFNIKDGKVLAKCGKTRKAKDMIAFMEDVARKYPDKGIHIVWDNLNIHKGGRWEMFNKKHGGRFHFHYTPIHASWVNQIEIWFGILARKSLRHGSFKSTRDLKNAVQEFIKYWNEKIGHAFAWTFKGYPLCA